MGLLSLVLVYSPTNAMEIENDFDRMMMRPITAEDFRRVINQERQGWQPIPPKRKVEDASLDDEEGPVQKKQKADKVAKSLLWMKNYLDFGMEDLSTFDEFPTEIKYIINTFMMWPNFSFKTEYEELVFGNPGRVAISIKSMMGQNQNTYPEGRIQWFAVAQQWTMANFTTWDLSTIQISTENIKVLAKALRTNKTLLKLHLSNTGLNCCDLILLGNMLCKNNTLKRLILSKNDIQDPGLAHLISVLTLHNSTLSHLDLSKNGFTQEMFSALGLFLETNTSITRLILNDFSGNDILIVKPLSKAIKKNSTLTELSLLNSYIGSDAVTILLEALKKNTTLTRLTLYYSFDFESDVYICSEDDSETEDTVSESRNEDYGIALVKKFKEQYGDRVNFYH